MAHEFRCGHINRQRSFARQNSPAICPDFCNDFPQRDPMDWRLLGSNDGGKTWSVLDERKGVIFSKRHQRQIFKIPNRTAFNVYRLEILRICKPSEANSVQLAELEPLGETEDDLDPLPLFADRIVTQGENPNLENGFNVFDGQIDTKWLDFANQHPIPGLLGFNGSTRITRAW